MNEWTPKTDLGREVMNGSVKSLTEIFESGRKIKEPEIVDRLLPSLQNDIIYIGGSPGKGGGIKRTPTRRTARMHRSGRRYKISALVIVGSEGFIGIGKSTAIEHKDAIEKATQVAKLNIMPVMRGCGSWECKCDQPHTLPCKTEGKGGSVRVVLYPAPKGIGICMNDEAKKIMRIAGIKDVWVNSYGSTSTRLNYTVALINAFKNLNRMRKGKEAKENE